MNRRELIVDAVNKLTEEHGYAPSVRELADAVNLKSTSTVQGHLERLKRDGRVDFEEGCPRTVRIVS
ncbi:transcriptional regulator [Sporolactobacillus laevolacticus]|uniref:Transcriptional regulator n=1 Tax=Sporolactobacillus laevolacticus DSM 442 TaxID=1395513 RepID=V6IXK0_9BACL|nr:transcriptional regulator [Sporolactobacillus laevolacticus]EST12030.1 transcriptional regulator [Sporolactobacillus laevolacticus DSM 442]